MYENPRYHDVARQVDKQRLEIIIFREIVRLFSVWSVNTRSLFSKRFEMSVPKNHLYIINHALSAAAEKHEG